MGQLAGAARSVLIILLGCTAALLASCDRAPEAIPTTAAPATQTTQLTIASVMPAATDILLAMGLQNRIVGVSNYEPSDSPIVGVDRVGDYHALDWERLYRIRPGLLIIPRQKQAIAPVVQQRAGEIGLQLVQVHIDTLDDIYLTIEQLGAATAEPESATELTARLKHGLKDISTRVAGREPVRTLIVMDEQARFAVGAPSYLDDLLTIAGGKNVAAGEMKDYPKIDLERLLQLDPDAVIQLLPGAPPQLVDSARSFWAKLPNLKAVRNGRIYIHTEPHLMLPGARVVDVARLIAADLHPLTAAPPATTTVTH